jgi:protein PhnA
MDNPSDCPKCSSDNIYQDGNLWVCPECANEWRPHSPKDAVPQGPEGLTVRDAHGNILAEGDSITVIKDLKVKGSSSVVKVGTKVRNIHLVDGNDGHNISCKIDGFGAMNLKSEYVKKA